ncbi:unnamed protein product [Paramecium primaurelia]|uniref:Uncharacterized protein n=1 Tax=Paramecium primaurelia TaxID=5886 RepID=A0A8S1M4H9_PARPR|nr:unnamed protein product [Paramecium primaurelia]
MYNNSQAGMSQKYYQPQKPFGYQGQPSQSQQMNSRYGNPYAQQMPQDDYLRDYNQRYDRNLHDLQTNGQTLSELEFRLDEERKNMKNVRQQLENNLENERQMRIEFETKIIAFRDDIQRKENIIQELDYKLQDTMMRNESLEQENLAMRNEFIRGQESYNQRLREYEDRIKFLNRKQQENDDKYRIEFERLIKSHDQKISDMTQTFKIQREDAEAQIKSFKTQIQDLNQDITNLMNENMRIKLEAEENIRETVVRVQDEEMRKYLGHLRNVEQKLKASEEGRDKLAKDYNNTLSQLADKERLLKQKQMEYDQNYTRFKQEISELDAQFKQTNQVREKLRNELQSKDQIIKQLQAESMDLQKQVQKVKEHYAHQIAEIQEINSQEKRDLEKEKDDLARKLNQSEETRKQMEEHIERLKLQLEELGGQIHQNIERSIYQTINQTSFSSKFENRRPFQPQKYQ